MIVPVRSTRNSWSPRRPMPIGSRSCDHHPDRSPGRCAARSRRQSTARSSRRPRHASRSTVRMLRPCRPSSMPRISPRDIRTLPSMLTRRTARASVVSTRCASWYMANRHDQRGRGVPGPRGARETARRAGQAQRARGGIACLPERANRSCRAFLQRPQEAPRHRPNRTRTQRQHRVAGLRPGRQRDHQFVQRPRHRHGPPGALARSRRPAPRP